MADPDLPVMPLPDWLVLCAVCERPAHGWAIAVLLGSEGELGRVWRVPRPVVYRILSRLTDRGLIRPLAGEASAHGPDRLPLEATGDGRRAAAAWLARPARHGRDIRSELLVKLALLDRAGADPGGLIAAQRALLAPAADALQARLSSAAGYDRTLLLWRAEAMSAVLRFLDEIAVSA